MSRAHASHAARQNLAALLHELRKNVGALVVDEIHLLDTELADFLFAEILTLAATRSAGTATWTTGAATFTTSTTAAMTTTVTFATGTRCRRRRRWSGRRWRWRCRSRRRCWRVSLRIFLFLCHNFLPFDFAPGLRNGA